MAIAEIKNLSKKYSNSGKTIEVIKNVSFEVNDGEFVSVIGPNGCGKSTLFSILLGLNRPDSGQVNIESGTKIGFVFQNYRDTLMPWASVLENVLLPLEEVKISKKQKLQKARVVLTEVGLKKFEESLIYEISGGMAQLVVLARAIITDPGLLLLDEPFSALDYQRSLQMQELLTRIWEKRPIPAFMISHDIDEAIYLSDKVIMLSSRPSTIIDTVNIDLPRPRSFHSRLSPEFAKYRDKLLKIIESNEVAF